MKRILSHKRKTQRHIARYVLPVFLGLAFFGCLDNFDVAITKEVEISKIVETKNEWTGLRTATTPRSGAASAIIGSWLYIHGGKDSSGVLDDLWRINLENGESYALTGDNSRAYHTMTAIGEKLYLFGGINASGNATQTLKAYNTVSGLWESEIGTSDTNGPFPGARSGHVSFTWSGYLFIQGGEDSGSAVDSDLYRLELKSSKKHRWTKLVAGEFRSGHGAAVVGNVLYLVGGCHPGDNSYYKNMWTYNLEDDNTTTITVDSDALERKNISLVAIDEILYTFGGETSSGLSAELLAGTTSGDWFSYNGEAQKRSNYVLQQKDNTLFLFGGHNDAEDIYYNDLWIVSLQR